MNDITNALTRNDVRIAAAAGLLVGGGISYILTKRHYKKFYRDRAEEEIESVKDTYKLLRKEPPYDKPETATRAYLERLDELQFLSEGGVIEEEATDDVSGWSGDEPEAVVEADRLLSDEFAGKLDELGYSGLEPDEVTVEQRVTTTNVFDPVDDEDELPPRDPDNPYIISVDMFMTEEEDFDKITISYYEGDDTLSDEREQIIADVERTVGQGNLLHFGLGSKDKRIVYIRNERIKTDFEVVREEGSYSVMVLGMHEDYLEHQDRPPRIRKMRDERDSR